MYEPWVMTIDLSSVAGDASDPDFPNSGKLTKYSTKPARTGIAMVTLVQSKEICIRAFYADYLEDRSPTGEANHSPLLITFIYLFSALAFMEWCCSGHPGSGFHIRKYFRGRFLYQDSTTLKLFYGDVDESDREEILPPAKKKRPSKKKVRPLKERGDLKLCLLSWRTETHEHDPLAAVRPPSFILDDKGIKTLATMHLTEIRNTTQVVQALGESEEWDQEWSKKILTVIQTYDNELKGS